MGEQTTAPRDFSEGLHELRESELARLPAEATTVLHGGAADTWYFNWWDERYPGRVERHIAVEAFAPRPADLPEHVEWLQRTLGDMGPVADGSVDMVFAGQVIEHLWAEDVAGFLLESHRVLRPGGALAMDSPNRRVTDAIGWLHPEHTAELSCEEAVELVRLAGFDVDSLRGVLLGYDRSRHHFLELEDDRMSWDDRARLAPDRPEDSFVWWLVARRSERAPDAAALHRRAQELAAEFRARRLRRLTTPLPVELADGRAPVVRTPAAYGGPLLYGPYFPLDAGPWRAEYALRLEQDVPPGDAVVARLDVASSAGNRVHAERDVTVAELDPGGAWTVLRLDFRLPDMIMGVELRATATSGFRLGAQLQVRLLRPEDSPLLRAHEGGPRVPEPRTVELLATLRRRGVRRARALLPLRR